MRIDPARPAPPVSAGASLPVLVAEPWDGYALLDSGGGRKLERFGDVRLIRPEPQAMWRPADAAAWHTADARFEGGDDEDGRWSAALPDFAVPCGPARMVCRLTANRHVGLFPEQRPHWDDMAARVRPGDEVLNLFGYTGAASLILAAAGARVTHVDASKKAIAWARECQLASGLAAAPIRWIVDDAGKFAAREVRRGRRYQGILLDPPKFGRGPKGETWELFDHLAALLADVAALLSADARFLVLTAYAIRASALAFDRLLREVLPRDGTIAAGELAVREANGRLLPAAMFSAWHP